MAIDATCGNGFDALFLAEHLLSLNESGSLRVIDKQPQAIEATKQRLAQSLTQDRLERVFFYCQCHSKFPDEIAPNSVKLIVYNLGYLPGSDKSIKTQDITTLQSIQAALKLIIPGGMISITCYPGHHEGAIEEKMLLEFTSSLPSAEWSCCHHRWVNRQNAPSLLLLQKSVDKSHN